MLYRRESPAEGRSCFGGELDSTPVDDRSEPDVHTPSSTSVASSAGWGDLYAPPSPQQPAVHELPCHTWAPKPHPRDSEPHIWDTVPHTWETEPAIHASESSESGSDLGEADMTDPSHKPVRVQGYGLCGWRSLTPVQDPDRVDGQVNDKSGEPARSTAVTDEVRTSNRKPPRPAAQPPLKEHECDEHDSPQDIPRRQLHPAEWHSAADPPPSRQPARQDGCLRREDWSFD